MIPNVLSIAGSDPSGGAGIQADLKAISANGGYAMAAITALTAQNTRGVSGIELVPAPFVAAQIDAVFDDIDVHAVKIGMIANAAIADAVAAALERHAAVRVILDPVMIAKGGDRLLAEDAVATLRERLLPLADVLTPNLPEAAALLDEAPARDTAAMAAQAERLRALGPSTVLLKGGHLDGDVSPDCFCGTDGRITWFEATRVATRNTHGTGCTLSSALAARYARHDPLVAVEHAKAYVSAAIAAAGQLTVGSGHGPLHHFFDPETAS